MEMNDHNRQPNNLFTDAISPDQIKRNSPERVTRSSRKKSKTEIEEGVQQRNTISDCPITDSQCNDFQAFELKKKQRDNESEIIRKQRNTKEREDHLQKKSNETSEETERRNKRKRENEKQRRSRETVEY